jgi:ribonucleoside-diphosphate reductase alpha chain
MSRRTLPQRRHHEVLELAVDSIHYTVGVGRFGDGSPAEVFMNSNKIGTAADTNARDAAILLSFLLQHGADIDDVARALTRKTDGTPLGPIGHVALMLSSEIKAVDR